MKLIHPRQDWHYTPAAKTTPQTLMALFKRHGFVPPAQTRLEKLLKGQNNEMQSL